jgi:hypothetical protein
MIQGEFSSNGYRHGMAVQEFLYDTSKKGVVKI